MNPIISFFRELARNFRVADFLDILIISFFIYTAMIWFKRTTSRSVVIGISLFTLLYFLARKFDLYLTSLVFQAIFAILLLALIVVFQEEIRRGFERIAIWGTWRDRRRRTPFPGVDTLIEGISTLASNRIGALIVIKGREPLDRHVEGGVPLYGRLSKLLLYSLFDPHSPGHDGAVLIEGDRISKFGAHLPLSKNLAEVGALGTRHTAALGMSECSDSFVIVVSEERGVISVAEDGKLQLMESAAKLKDRLERFSMAKFPKTEEPDWKRWFKENARIKVLSLFLAVTAWFQFAYRAETIQRTFAVPIEYRNLPEDWYLEGTKPVEVMVTLSGSGRAFNLMNPSSLVISLDLAKVHEGAQRFFITEEDLRRPPNLNVFRLDPNLVALEAHRMVLADLPVEVPTQGELSKHLRLVNLKVQPTTLRVKVRSAQSEATEKLLTEPIDLTQITQTTLLRVNLLLPEYVRLLEGSTPEVRVTVEVAEEKEEGSP